MKRRMLICAVFAIMTCPVMAALPLVDDFEGGGPNWTKWPGPGANDTFIRDPAHNHTPGGTWAALTPEADPAGWVSYADFGPQSGFVRGEVALWDDLDDNGTNPARPVSAMLQLSGAGNPADFTDYLQLGVCAWYDPNGLTQKYYIRTRYNDENHLGYVDTGVYRKQGWTKLAIEADALALGSAARFYIDDQLVYTSTRWSGIELAYVRLGLNFKSYDNIWYDDVRVTPEPVTLLLLSLGGLAIFRHRRR